MMHKGPPQSWGSYIEKGIHGAETAAQIYGVAKGMYQAGVFLAPRVAALLAA